MIARIVMELSLYTVEELSASPSIQTTFFLSCIPLYSIVFKPKVTRAVAFKTAKPKDVIYEIKYYAVRALNASM